MEAMTVTNVSHLMLSSFLGILIGDLAELEALRLVGARRVLIVDTIKPFGAALLGHLILDEKVLPAAFLGIVLTVCGVLLVLMVSLENMETGASKEAKKMKRHGMKRSSISMSSMSVRSIGSLTTLDEEEETVVFTNLVKKQLSRHSLFTEYEGAILEAAEEDEASDHSSHSSESWQEGTPLMWKEEPTGLDIDEESNHDIAATAEEKREAGTSTPTRLNTKSPMETSVASKSSISSNREQAVQSPGNMSRGGLKKAHRLNSMSSMSSFNSECGPPPGYYPNNPSTSKENSRQRNSRLRRGYALALLNVSLDAYGSLLTKQYGIQMTTWEINLIRLGFAGLVMLVISIVMHINERLGIFSSGSTSAYMSKESVPWYALPKMAWGPWLVVSMGVLFVTFLCPALSNFALFEISLALAVTLCSITPLYTLPLMWLLKNEKPTAKGCLGAFLAVLGVIVLCIWGMELQ